MEHHVKGGVPRKQNIEELDELDLRRGPWTVDEDFILINYIARHGEGRWNSLSHNAGLKRTGKSCRLRWLNYLRPNVRRGNITLEEQLLILELHSRWGNRWSKIAQHLPGRTDNEIKNYWRTRVQKHAKQLKCDVNSKQFKDTMRYLWMPRLVERIQAAAAASDRGSPSTTTTPTSTIASTTTYQNLNQNYNTGNIVYGQVNMVAQSNINNCNNYGNFQLNQSSYTTENSSTAASSDSFGTQVSPISELTDCYNYSINNQANDNNNQASYGEPLISPVGYLNQGLNFQSMDQNSPWIDGGDTSDNLWDFWFLQQQ